MSKILGRTVVVAFLALGLVAMVAPAASAGPVGFWWGFHPGRPEEPVQDSDAGPPVHLDRDRVSRGGTVVVTTEGCRDDLRYTEARLVLGNGSARYSVVVADDGGSGTVELMVPRWALAASAVVEASCLEPSFSGASDGAAVHVFDFAPASIKIRGGRWSLPPVAVALGSADQGVLRLAGTRCAGTLRVSVAQGTDRVAAGDRFHYGTTTIEAPGGYFWITEVPLHYSVSTFLDPIAAGDMVAFASCDGLAYTPVSFRIAPSEPQPALQILEWDAAGVYASQCLEGNTLSISATATTTGGAVSAVDTSVPGPGYGESFTFLDLPADLAQVTYTGECTGSSGPNFTYQPATWSGF